MQVNGIAPSSLYPPRKRSLVKKTNSIFPNQNKIMKTASLRIIQPTITQPVLRTATHISLQIPVK